MRTNEQLTISAHLVIEGEQGTDVVAYRWDTKARMRLGAAVYALMQRFTSPCSIDDVTDGLAMEENQRALTCIRKLVERGFLVRPEDKDGTLFSDLRIASPTLFQCPRGSDSAPGDIAVMGLPFDLGNRLGTGSRDAPEAIRRRSFDHDYRVDFQSGRPMGWHDIDRSRHILEGVEVRDWGDVTFRYGETSAMFYKRVEEVASRMVRCGAHPVAIGGDHSSTFGVVKALLGRYSRLAVIWLDAHTDTSPIHQGESHNNASVVRSILGLNGVVKVIQCGLRGYSLYDKVAQRPDKMAIVTAGMVKAHGPNVVLDQLPRDIPCYVSIDIDILDPAFAPAVAGPIPFGLTSDALMAILTALDDRQIVAGFDVMEVAPALDNGITTLALVCQLLLAGMSAIASFRRAADRQIATLSEE